MIRVLHDRVLVALPPANETQEATTGFTVQDLQTTASGILLAKPADSYNVERSTRGIVAAIGERSRIVDVDEVREQIAEYFRQPHARDLEDVPADVDAVLRTLLPAPFEVQVGDCVVFPASAGEQIRDGEIEYVILREAEIIGIVEPLKKDEAA